MSDSTVYIGLDPTGGTRATTYAILDERRRIAQLGEGSLDEVIQIVLAYPSAVCGIDAPCGRNHGLMADPAYREQLGLDAGRRNYSTFRVCEYELRRRGIYIYNTSPDEDALSGWMLEGWRLYDALRARGYVDYPGSGARQLFETYPHAAFTVLVGSRPYPKGSLEGRLQRQAILYDLGVNVPDPMHTLEEWTRYRLLRGQINLDNVRTHDELDALVAAYTAYLVTCKPEDITAVGDPEEGQIVIPIGDLQDTY